MQENDINKKQAGSSQEREVKIEVGKYERAERRVRVRMRLVRLMHETDLASYVKVNNGLPVLLSNH